MQSTEDPSDDEPWVHGTRSDLSAIRPTQACHLSGVVRGGGGFRDQVPLAPRLHQRSIRLLPNLLLGLYRLDRVCVSLLRSSLQEASWRLSYSFPCPISNYKKIFDPMQILRMRTAIAPQVKMSRIYFRLLNARLRMYFAALLFLFPIETY